MTEGVRDVRDVRHAEGGGHVVEEMAKGTRREVEDAIRFKKGERLQIQHEHLSHMLIVERHPLIPACLGDTKSQCHRRMSGTSTRIMRQEDVSVREASEFTHTKIAVERKKGCHSLRVQAPLRHEDSESHAQLPRDRRMRLMFLESLPTTKAEAGLTELQTERG